MGGKNSIFKKSEKKTLWLVTKRPAWLSVLVLSPLRGHLVLEVAPSHYTSDLYMYWAPTYADISVPSGGIEYA